MSQTTEPLDEPTWPWQAKRLVRATELLDWAQALPSAEMCIQGNFDGLSNPKIVQGLVVGSVAKPGTIFAADPANGNIVWTHPIGHIAIGNIVADDDLIYAGTPNHIRAIRIKDGVREWTFVPRMQGQDRIYSTPLLQGNSLYISDRSGHMHRIGKEKGKLFWSTRVDPKGHNANGSPNFIGGLVVVGTNSGILAACDPDSGRLVWSKRLEGPVSDKTQVLDGMVVGKTPGGITLLDFADGSVVRHWSPKNEEVVGSLVAGTGILVVLRSKENHPTPLAPQMTHMPQRLALLDRNLAENWSIPYPPYATPRLSYDPELGIALESTSAGLGFVDVDRGIRVCVVHAFPRKLDLPQHEVSQPYKWNGHLYGITSEGTLWKMRYIEIGN